MEAVRDLNNLSDPQDVMGLEDGETFAAGWKPRWPELWSLFIQAEMMRMLQRAEREATEKAQSNIDLGCSSDFVLRNFISDLHFVFDIQSIDSKFIGVRFK